MSYDAFLVPNLALSAPWPRRLLVLVLMLAQCPGHQAGSQAGIQQDPPKPASLGTSLGPQLLSRPWEHAQGPTVNASRTPPLAGNSTIPRGRAGDLAGVFPPPRKVLQKDPRGGKGKQEAGLVKYRGIPGSRIVEKNVSSWKFRRRMQCLSTRGRWVYHPEPRPIAWNAEGLEHCDRKWVAEGRGRAAGPQANTIRNASRWNVRETLKYSWEVDPSCGEWMDFRKSWFCSALSHLGGSLMLVGDSITRYMNNDIHNHLAMASFGGGPPSLLLRSAQMYTPPLCKMWEDRGFMDKRMKLCKVMAPCPGGHKVYHIRNDWLTLVKDRPVNNSHGYFVPWLSLIGKWGVRVVLLNRGVHFRHTKSFKGELEETVRTVRKWYPNLLIMYRGTPVGHANCDDHRKPLSSPQVQHLPFHWSDLPEQNAIAKRVVEHSGGVYLNVETMTSFRADGHFGTFNGKVDCMHYCNPGPVDEWTKLFFNSLIELL